MANPWTNAEWNLTEQGNVVRLRGLIAAQKLAKEAGTTVGGPRPIPPNERPIIRNFFLTKRIGSTTNQMAGGRGYAGDGPPDESVGS